jgi:penicillin amidase
VVAPSHSASGHALLANDPHLYPRIPPVWYVAHFQAEDIDVAGATLPAIPGVIIGHNQRIAWGVTAGMADCEDLFIEKPDPAGPHRFFFRDQSEPATVLRESFAVRGGKTPLEEDVVRTHHGPLLNGTLGIPPDAPPVALRSALHDWSNPVQGLLKLNQARDWASFKDALRDWSFPCLNFVYADVDGNIGYKLAGQVPIRAQGEGYAPVEGWTGENEWTGYVPFEDMPEAFNPPEGIFATANSRPATPPGNHFLARDWVDDSRWRRIIELLKQRPKTSVEDCKAIHADVVSLPAREVMEKLRRETDVLPPPPPSPQGGGRRDPRPPGGGRRDPRPPGGGRRDARPPGGGRETDSTREAALRALAGWKGSLAPDQVAPAIYHAFRIELLRLLCTDLPRTQLEQVLGRGIDPLMAPVSTFYFRGSSELLAHLERAEPAFVRQALHAAIERLRAELGEDVSRWQWGRVHRMTFAHPIGLGVPALDRLLHLSRGPVPIGGDADTVAQAGVDPWHPFAANSYMVSYRQIFDLGDWDRGQFILPVGQSGHPGSRHYDDMLEAWSTVEYRPLRYSRPAVESAVSETISLQPVRQRNT